MEAKQTVKVDANVGSPLRLLGDAPATQRFHVVRRVGQGSMGVVFEAVDTHDGARVALKTLTGVTPGAIYRLKNEFRALADVAHPNLVGLHELFAEGASWFFTMELVDGIAFDDYVRSERPSTARDTQDIGATLLPTREEACFDEQRLRETMLQLASGVHALHEAGKLHRDLKPSNVLVTASGQVKILDFGLVSDESSDAVGQTLREVVGTPAYMSPDQARGVGMSCACDWYAVGVMLYEAMTGRLPFDGEPHDLMFAKQIEDVLPPSALVAVPRDLEELCLALLSPIAAQRPLGDDVVARLRAGLASNAPSQPASDIPTSAGTSTAPVSYARALVPFVGRDAELQALQAALAGTDHGAALAMHLHGVSGIGKSALAARFAALAASRGAVVLKGRCYERESVPYKGIDGIIDALSRYLRRLRPSEAARLLPRGVHALSTVFPVLARVEEISAAPRRSHATPIDPQELRRRAFDALREMLGKLADATPLLLYVDDFQWADLDSVQLLATLLAPPDPPPLMLMLVYRSDEREHSEGLLALSEELARHGIEERSIELRGLPQNEIAALAQSQYPSGSSPDVLAIWRESEGNPFFLHELLRQARASSSMFPPAADGGELRTRVEAPDLREALLARVRTLPESAQRLLQASAVAAHPTLSEVLAEAADVQDAPTQLRKLHSEHLLRSLSGYPGLVETYHDRLREAVAASLSQAERSKLHARLASALERQCAEPEMLAEHFLAAGDDDNAFIHARRAGERAEAALAFERAARFYGIAIRTGEVTRPHEANALHARHAAALASAGRCLEAADAYQLASSLASGDDAARLHMLSAAQLLMAGRAEEGLTRLEHALARFGVEVLGDDAASTQRIGELFMQYRALTEQFASDVRFVREEDLSSEERTRLDMIHTAALGLAWLDMGNRYFGLALQNAKASLEAGEPTRILRSACLLHSIYEAIDGEVGAAEKAIFEQVKARVDTPAGRAYVYYLEGSAAYFRTRLHDACEAFGKAEALFANECQGAARELAIVRIPYMISMRFSGRLIECVDAGERWGRAAREQGDMFTALWMQLMDITPLCADEPTLARARVEDALAQLEPFVARSGSPMAAAVVRLIGQVRRADFDWYEGNNDSAYAHIELLVREHGPGMQAAAASVTQTPLHTMQIVWHRTRALSGALAMPEVCVSDWQEQMAQLLAQYAAFKIRTMTAGHALRAAAAKRAGDIDTAIALLKAEAEYARDVLAQPVWVACNELHAARLARDTARVEQAESELRALGVKNPARWAQMTVPGF